MSICIKQHLTDDNVLVEDFSGTWIPFSTSFYFKKNVFSQYLWYRNRAQAFNAVLQILEINYDNI